MTQTTPSSDLSTPGAKVNRRDVLKLAWISLGGLAVLELAGATLSYMQPRLAEGEFGGVINAGNVADFPNGSVTHIPAGRFYLVRLQDGGFLALHQRCTHLGCSVPWDQAAGEFICPCHSSRFSIEGDVINAPAPRPLDLFAITITGGAVLVDTSTSVQRQKYEPSQAVYA